MKKGPGSLCVKCVLPEHRPDITFNAAGQCSLCSGDRDGDRRRRESPLLETDFVKILTRNKKRGRYHCLVMCSGGKDSTAALYYMKKRYKLEPLAFTFDNGFEPPDALENVRNAVERLGVDHFMFKSDFMLDMFAAIVKSKAKAVICHVCSIRYMDVALRTAAGFAIPVVIGGWTKGQSSPGGTRHPEFSSMAKGTADFLAGFRRQDPKYGDFPASVGEVMKRAGRQKPACTVISPHWFLPFDREHYSGMIERELGWKPAASSYPAGSTNCRLNFLSVLLSMKHYGYSHYHAEMSRMIRMGVLTREEALRRLEIDFKEEDILPVLDKLGCRPEDICF